MKNNKTIYRVDEKILGPDYILLTIPYKNSLYFLDKNGINYRNIINDNRYNKTILAQQIIKFNKVYISIADKKIKLYYAFKYGNESYLYMNELERRNIRKTKTREGLNEFIKEITNNPNKLIISGNINLKTEEEILIDLKNELFEHAMKLREHILDEPYLTSSKKLIEIVLDNIDNLNLSEIKNNYLLTNEPIFIADYENYGIAINEIDITYESHDKYNIVIKEYVDEPTYEIIETINSKEFSKDIKRRLKI